MNESVLLHGAEPREVLQSVIEKQASAIMSYLSRGKWHGSGVHLTYLGATRLYAEVLSNKEPKPVNVSVDQPVGVSIKCGYGKFIFRTTVLGFEPPSSAKGGGIIVLAVPKSIEIVQRRSYFRVVVPEQLVVNAHLWHCSCAGADSLEPAEDYFRGRLVDISAGGAQVAIAAFEKPDFKKGQVIGLEFTPMPYEEPLVFCAKVRTMLPTADQESICISMQMVGMEVSSQGKQQLQRLCRVVERYHQINQCGAKQQDFKTTSLFPAS